MALRLPNLPRLVWRYMRGEDIKEASDAAVARAQAALPENSPYAPTTGPVATPPRSFDRRRM